MRRSKKSSGVIYIIIAVIVIGIIVGKFLISGNSEKKYMKYVESFEKGIYEYCNNDLSSDTTVISFDELKELLIGRGYVNEYDDPSVLLLGDDINISRVNGEVSFYNYKNTNTYENGFMIKFNHNNKIVSCTKNKCN